MTNTKALTRSAEARATRAAESREMNMTLEYNMEYTSPLDPPPGVMKDDHDYCWPAYEFQGQATYDVQKKAAQGWSLVPRDRAPEFSFDPMKRNPMEGQYLCWGPHVLMERHKRLGIREQEHHDQKKMQVLNSLRGTVTNDLQTGFNSVRRISEF